METGTIISIILEIILAGVAAYYYKNYKSAKKDVDLILENNETLKKIIVKKDERWSNELTAAQVTIENLRMQLPSEQPEVKAEQVVKKVRAKKSK